jgi:hypothetical protein
MKKTQSAAIPIDAERCRASSSDAAQLLHI